MGRNCFRLLVLLAVLTISLTGCTGQTLKIGLMADLTGRASGLGISARNGAELAVEAINRGGGIKGKPIELLVKDDKGLPEEAVKVDTELIQEKALLGIGHMTSGTGTATLDTFKRGNILMISPLISTESLTGTDDLFIRVIGSNQKQGELLAKTALAKSPVKKTAIVFEYNNRAYAREVGDYFKYIYEQGGGEIVYENSFVSSPDADLEKIASEVSASGASGALIVTGGVDLGVLVQLIKKQSPEMMIFSGMWGMTEDAITKGGKAIEGAYFPGVYDSQNQNSEFVSFRKSYMERYKEEPTFASLYTYETLSMVAEALKASQKLDTASIKEALLKISHYKGLQQDFNLDRYGDSDRGYFLFQVRNANFVKAD